MLRPRPIPATLNCNRSIMDNRSFPGHPDSGEPVLLRPIGRHEAGRVRAGIAALSDHSRYLRFFNGGQAMPEYVIQQLCDADGPKHIAGGTIYLASPGEPAIGGGHAIRKGTSCDAGLALAVLDDWQGKGLAWQGTGVARDWPGSYCAAWARCRCTATGRWSATG